MGSLPIGGVTLGWNWSEGLLLCWPVGVVVLRAEAQVGLVVNEVGGIRTSSLKAVPAVKEEWSNTTMVLGYWTAPVLGVL